VREVQKPTTVNRAQVTFRRGGATARVYPFLGATQLGQGRGSRIESTAHHGALGIGLVEPCEHAGCVHFVRVNDASWVVRMGQAKREKQASFVWNMFSTLKALHKTPRQKCFSDEKCYAMFRVLCHVFRVLFDDAQHTNITRHHRIAHITCF
jgi:hypothetical protein